MQHLIGTTLIDVLSCRWNDLAFTALLAEELDVDKEYPAVAA